VACLKFLSATSNPTVPTGLPELLRAEDVAKALSVSKGTVYQMAQGGEIPSIRIGTCLRFDPADVLEFVRACRRERRGTP
jgi:excisionase family DNA binding protein